jgi:hypothetical protein
MFAKQGAIKKIKLTVGGAGGGGGGGGGDAGEVSNNRRGMASSCIHDLRVSDDVGASVPRKMLSMLYTHLSASAASLFPTSFMHSLGAILNLTCLTYLSCTL